MSHFQNHFVEEFSYILEHALKLETVDNDTFRSQCLWTPFVSTATYGGQLVAHTVESAYRTAGKGKHIHSLRLAFIDRGISESADPIVYSVVHLREGKSFCIRQVQARQGGRLLLSAVASFHRNEKSGLEHQLVMPSAHDLQTTASLDKRLHELQQRYHVELEAKPSIRVDETQRKWARVDYMNLIPLAEGETSALFQDVWMRLRPEGLSLLSAASDIPLDRIHLIICCWLSDFTVAMSVFLPHGDRAFKNMKMVASLDHAIYFHRPMNIRVDKWFLFDIKSSWAGNNRGLNHGRMYGGDGKLWMSVAQETCIRMQPNFYSKV